VTPIHRSIPGHSSEGTLSLPQSFGRFGRAGDAGFSCSTGGIFLPSKNEVKGFMREMVDAKSAFPRLIFEIH